MSAQLYTNIAYVFAIDITSAVPCSIVLSLMFTANLKFQVQSGKPREPAQESQLSMQGFEFGIESDWSIGECELQTHHCSCP